MNFLVWASIFGGGGGSVQSHGSGGLIGNLYRAGRCLLALLSQAGLFHYFLVFVFHLGTVETTVTSLHNAMSSYGPTVTMHNGTSTSNGSDFTVKAGLAQMLKGGVIMDVVNAEQVGPFPLSD